MNVCVPIIVFQIRFFPQKNEVTKEFDNETSKIFLLRCEELEAMVKKKKRLIYIES